MRLWVHVIWLKKNPTTPLALCGPKEDRKLEYLIQQYGEDKTAYAWYLYVNAKPAPYNLKPVKHVDKFTTAKGNIMTTTVKDAGAITRFPLSAFLAVEAGFTIQSCLHYDAFTKAHEQRKAAKTKNPNDTPPTYEHLIAEILGIPSYDGSGADIFTGIREAYKAQTATTASLKPAWGVTQKDLEDDEF